MQKLPECLTCQFHAKSQYIVCAVHPNGCSDISCLDYRRDPRISTQPHWAPVGYTFYGGDLIENFPSQLDQRDGRCLLSVGLRPVGDHRETILDTHPLFTGRCAECGHELRETSLIHWDCPSCGWKDDSV